MAQQSDQTVLNRPLSRPMRLVLWVAATLVFISGIQLFVLSDVTADYFAWTIRPSLTAAFLGAAYWASCGLELLAARKRWWVEARIAVPAVLLFTSLTLVVTLLHFDRFHFNRPEWQPRWAAWAWLGIYALVPPLLAVVGWFQLRQPGGDAPRRDPLAWWVHAVLLAHVLILLPAGLLLLIVPQNSLPYWPWSLTPLTARAIGAWLVSLALAAAHASWENDWQRVQVATMTYILFSTLQLIALARYPADLLWDRPAIYLLLAVLLSMLLGGLYGWFRSHLKPMN